MMNVKADENNVVVEALAPGLDVENIKVFRGRINSFLKEVQEKYSDKNVLIVTHAGVIIYMRCFFEGDPKDGNYERYKPKNGEVITYDNSYNKKFTR